MRFVSILLIGLLSLTVLAQRNQAASRLQSLETSQQGSAWDAVGRVNIGDGGFCTGALIAERLVLTAAHCMYDRRTGRQVETDELEFLAGWRNGRASAYRKARRVVIHEDYLYDSPDRMGRVAADIALIELDQPIRNTTVKPFETHRRPRVGQIVHVVSYAQNRAEAPSLQESCQVLGRDPAVLVLSCKVDFGASGAPIFVEVDGKPMIASVVSAKADWRDQPVALGASLGAPLQALMATLRLNDGTFRRASVGASGSKFLRP